jgi:hypothetical protein
METFKLFCRFLNNMVKLKLEGKAELSLVTEYYGGFQRYYADIEVKRNPPKNVGEETVSFRVELFENQYRELTKQIKSTKEPILTTQGNLEFIVKTCPPSGSAYD